MATKKIAMLVASMLLPGVVHADNSVELKVTGTLTNSTCTPAIDDGGVIDMGHVPVKNMEAENTLGYKSISFQHKKVDVTITCSTDMLVAYDLTDNKSGTVPSSFANYMGAYGFGKTTDEKDIGLYQLNYSKATIDGVEGSSIYTNDSGNSWKKSTLMDPNNRYSFGKKDQLTPSAGKVFKLTMDTAYYFEKEVVDSMQDDIPFEGSATFTLVYL